MALETDPPSPKSGNAVVRDYFKKKFWGEQNDSQDLLKKLINLADSTDNRQINIDNLLINRKTMNVTLKTAEQCHDLDEYKTAEGGESSKVFGLGLTVQYIFTSTEAPLEYSDKSRCKLSDSLFDLLNGMVVTRTLNTFEAVRGSEWLKQTVVARQRSEAKAKKDHATKVLLDLHEKAHGESYK